MTIRDEYVAKLKTQLDRWNADVGKWEAEARKAQDKLQVEYNAQLRLLHEQQEKARYNLKLLEGASASAWQDVARGADQAWDAMRAAVERARTHFEKK